MELKKIRNQNIFATIGFIICSLLYLSNDKKEGSFVFLITAAIFFVKALITNRKIKKKAWKSLLLISGYLALLLDVSKKIIKLFQIIKLLNI